MKDLESFSQHCSSERSLYHRCALRRNSGTEYYTLVEEWRMILFFLVVINRVHESAELERPKVWSQVSLKNPLASISSVILTVLCAIGNLWSNVPGNSEKHSSVCFWSAHWLTPEALLGIQNRVQIPAHFFPAVWLLVHHVNYSSFSRVKNDL